MELPLHPDCRVLKAERELIAVDKAAGVLSHPNRAADQAKSLLGVPYDAEREVYIAGENSWFLLNRLDSPTSGVILLTSDLALATAVRAAFASGGVEKTYIALVKGIPRCPRERWQDFLRVERSGGRLRTRVSRGAPNAVTRMEVLQRGRGVPARSLLQLSPETGRTHQLRAQCAARSLPILGDANYGDFATNRELKRRLSAERLFLHSHKTQVELRLDSGNFRFVATSPIPSIFSVALEGS
jgi:23S rRNA-/tRNA-specific pseudouridylate synthase